jgi:hypothetical protein
MQKIRRQERGHEAAERRLITLGARAPRAGERPADWLADALVAIGARYAQHPGCHKYAFRLGETRRDRAAVVIAPPRLPYPKWPQGVPPAPVCTSMTGSRRR